jgi:NADP-dependent alcohol dehydrogenase
LYGLDHAQTLAVVLPSMLRIRRDTKHTKLVQYAERVWGITDGTEDQRIDAAIERTRDFFESLGVKTRLSEYDLGLDVVDPLVKQLEAHGMTRLGERQEVDLTLSRQVYAASV